MTGKLLKIFMAGIVLANFFCTNIVSAAYDLPVIKAEKPKKVPKNPKKASEKKSILKIKPNKEDVPVTDENYVLIGEYKGSKYYLDRYSIKVKKNSAGEQSWSQFIFPIGAHITPTNARSTAQKFYFDGKNAYNSTRPKNLLNDVEDESDKNFLWKCFRIGYFYAFNQELEQK